MKYESIEKDEAAGGYLTLEQRETKSIFRAKFV